MIWQMPYAIVRIGNDGSAEIVHSAATMRDARYWLQYIALPGDALVQTPCHPKHPSGADPTYVGHLAARGKIAHDEQQWRVQVMLQGQMLRWKEEPASP